MLQRRLDELVHGDVGLYEGDAADGVDGEDARKGGDVDGARGRGRTRAGAVCATVGDAEGFASREEVTDGEGDGGERGFVVGQL